MIFFKRHKNKSFLIQLITVECTPRMVLIRTFPKIDELQELVGAGDDLPICGQSDYQKLAA